MAQLTLYWPVGRYRIEAVSAGSGRTVIYPPGTGQTVINYQDAYELIWREGPALEKPVHNIATLYARLVKMPPKKFVKEYGLLWSRRGGKSGGETIQNIRLAQRELKKLLAAKKRDDWEAARKWMEKRPNISQLNATIGEDEAGRPQLEFRPKHLFGFIVAQLIQDWSSGAEYKFCKRPGCPEYFYFGAGTAHRRTAKYHSKKCQMADRYEKEKEQSK